MKKTISLVLALAAAATMSMPAMAANNDETMVISPAPSVAQQAQMNIIVNGKTVKAQGYTANGCVMVPIRAVAEALGYKVSWNADQSIKLNNGETQTDLSIGENNYFVYTAIDGAVGMTAPFSLGSAPVLKNNTTYVPAQLFTVLLGNDPATVKEDSNTVTINSSARSDDGDAAQIPNPLNERETLAELSKAVGFDIIAPSVPQGYKTDAYIDISGELAEIFYINSDDTLVYRISKGSGDISGDYNVYSSTKTIDVKGVSVAVSGAEKVNKATWEKNGFAYSLTSDLGLSDAQVSALIASVL